MYTAINNAFSNYFTPKVYTKEQLNYENGSSVRKITSKLDLTSLFLATLGITGTVVSLYKIHAALHFGAVTIPRMGIYLSISSLACMALALYCKQISNKHNASFPEHVRAQIAWDKLITLHYNWPNGGDNYLQVMERLYEINATYPLIDLYYDPKKDSAHPQIRINTVLFQKKLDALIQILFLAYNEGITLHFSHLEKSVHLATSFSDYFWKCKKSTSKEEELGVFRYSQDLSVSFINKVNEQGIVNNDKITRQLNALAPKVYIQTYGYAFQPAIKLTEAEEPCIIDLKNYFLMHTIDTVRNKDVPLFNAVPYYVRAYRWLRG